MKIVFPFIVCIITVFSFSPSFAYTEMQQTDTGGTIIFYDDFEDNKNNWTIGNNKNATTSMRAGCYYLTASGHAYGEAQEIKIDTRKNFQIETRIKILSGGSEHKHYYNMLFWGREANTGYYFTFAKDGFASVEVCSGKNQPSCIVKDGSFRRSNLDPNDFNVYMIRKTGNIYTFHINGTVCYTMPFTPFFGNLAGFGAGRNVSLAIDYFKVSYLD